MKIGFSGFRLIPMKTHIGVLGPNRTTGEQEELGHEVGRLIAEAGAMLFCGGLGGMMRAVAKGAQSAGGQTVGILPGNDKADANEFIDLAIPTGLDAYRNALLVRSCDAVIAVHGAYGTLSEIAYALRLKIPVVGLHTWTVSRDGTLDPGINTAQTAEEAVNLAMQLSRHPGGSVN